MNGQTDGWARKVAAIALLSSVLIGIDGCSSSAEDEDIPAIVEESSDGSGTAEAASESVDSFADFTGVYDSRFYDDVEFYVGEEITVAAIVGEVISPNVFTITDRPDTEEGTDDIVDMDEVIVEPLLVVHADEVPGLAPGTPVGVVGVVREDFLLGTIEGKLNKELDPAVFEQWEEQPYIEVVSATALR